MPQNAKIGALTDELIHSILKFDPTVNKQAYKHAKDVAMKSLRGYQYARTNQFDVGASFKGLDEKFRVLNRDDLADALGDRLKELQGKRNKWIPEYLSLLLELSDRPVENSHVESLELLKPPPSPPPLTWAQIIADDPLSDEEIWKDIDYVAESSEDEPVPKKRDKLTPSLPSSAEEDDIFDPESWVIPLNDIQVAEIESTQFWKVRPHEKMGKSEITELQAIRESLFMLAGLETSLYLRDERNSSVRVNQKFVLSHAIDKTVCHLLTYLAGIGRDLYRLRCWLKRPSSLPLIQTFEAAVRMKLSEYDRFLASSQQKYLVPSSSIAISLLELHSEVGNTSRPLLRLAELVTGIEHLLLVNPFAHLEALFERICIAQMTLENDVFQFFSEIFFDCLQVYLKPIRRWMESGELGTNDETFFVFENDSASEPSSLWHDRFVLRRGQGNALRAPSFLHPATQKIFNTGKSVVFLKELGIHGIGLDSGDSEPRLNHETVCGISSEVPLSPFSELFGSAFERWIRSKYSLASVILRTHLFSNCGLMNILSNFQLLYLGVNGSLFQEFADAVFERMDAGHSGWNDRFLLTELARGVFVSVLNKADIEKVVVRSARTKNNDAPLKKLNGLSIDYSLPWPIMNIVQRSSMPIYLQIFSLLLQVYRAKYLLQRIPWAGISQSQSSTQLSFKLRHRLIWFVDILRSYLTDTVIALSTNNMVAAMTKAEDIDEMSHIHIKYLARLQEQALLSQNLKPIHQAIIAILDISILYSDLHMEEPDRTKRPAKGSRRKSIVPTAVEDESSEADSEEEGIVEGRERAISASKCNFSEDLKRIDGQFTEHLSFLTAGLRSLGRVGAEPVWEMLADRLEWSKRNDCVHGAI
ncbi:hypothetical protein CC78DRAFT_529273 [Lojkania enalia]|uniref:Spindle pole body component n=1 Tax=Lojkania enalia TaxID=147567 RepID=A0A9P4TQG3_9PLEO|nr:hypothetical protein CC78DRAFT_529273 [Didymosphaeria enalia]